MTCVAATGPIMRSLEVIQCSEPPKNTEARAAGGAHALLPSPYASLSGSSDVGAQLAALIMEASREQKETAKETRAAAEQSQQAAEEHELAAMREESERKLAAGLIEGGTKMVGGAIGVGGAAAPTGSFASSAAKGFSALAEGAGRAGSAVATHYADQSKQEATEATQIVGRSKRAVDDARDLAKDAKEQLNRALGYYKEYLTAKSDTQKAALMRA